LLLGGVDARENENGLIQFVAVAYFGGLCQYASSTAKEFLHGIKQIHIVHGLGNPLASKLRLRMSRKVSNRLVKRWRGRARKLAVTIALVLELITGGGLHFTKWSSLVVAAAAVFGFVKQRRSGDSLRQGEHPDEGKCARVWG
jgi:hypothetical protein